jgi:hypothetical protein
MGMEGGVRVIEVSTLGALWSLFRWVRGADTVENGDRQVAVCIGDVLLALQTIYVAARAVSSGPVARAYDGNVLGNLGHRSSVV